MCATEECRPSVLYSSCITTNKGEGFNNCFIKFLTRLDDVDNSVRWKQRMTGKGGNPAFTFSVE